MFTLSLLLLLQKIILFPLAETAKGKCPRLTRAMGFMTPFAA